MAYRESEKKTHICTRSVNALAKMLSQFTVWFVLLCKKKWRKKLQNFIENNIVIHEKRAKAGKKIVCRPIRENCLLYYQRGCGKKWCWVSMGYGTYQAKQF